MKKIFYLFSLVVFTSLVSCNKKVAPKAVDREKFDEGTVGIIDTSEFTKATVTNIEIATGQDYNTSSHTVVPVDGEHSGTVELNLVEGEWQYEDPNGVYALEYVLQGTVHNYATLVTPDLEYCTFYLNPIMIKCVWDEDIVENGAPYHVHQTWEYDWDKYGRLTKMEFTNKKVWDLTGIEEDYTKVTLKSKSTLTLKYQ